MKYDLSHIARWIMLPFTIIVGLFLINGGAPYILRFIASNWLMPINNWFYYGIETGILGLITIPTIAIIVEYIAPNHKATAVLYSSIIVTVILVLIFGALLAGKLIYWGDGTQLTYIGDASNSPTFDGVLSITTLITKIVTLIIGMVWVHRHAQKDYY